MNHEWKYPETNDSRLTCVESKHAQSIIYSYSLGKEVACEIVDLVSYLPITAKTYWGQQPRLQAGCGSYPNLPWCLDTKNECKIQLNDQLCANALSTEELPSLNEASVTIASFQYLSGSALTIEPVPWHHPL